MKKKYLLFGIISFLFLGNVNVSAASTNITVSKNNVYVGDSFEVYANMKGSAAWNIHVNAAGPVSGCVINQADASADATDINKTFSAKCNATGVGKITLTLSGDVTSATDGNAVNIGGSVVVNVTNKPEPPKPSPSPIPSPKPSPIPSPKPSSKPLPPVVDNRSRNANIKELKIIGYNITKINNNNYKLEVPNGTNKINITGVPEDRRSKITGLGPKDLKIGENNFSIVVISEAGTKNIINLKVIRKDGYYIGDLDIALKDSEYDIDITINKDTLISTSDIEKIKKSNKRVNLNYFDQNKKLVYKYVLEGNKITDLKEFKTTLELKEDISEDILKASNYSEGILYYFINNNGFPKGTKIIINIGNKYKDNTIVNCYGYKEDTKELKLINKDLIVKDSLIEITLDKLDTNNYLVTRSNIGNKEIVKEVKKEGSNSLLIVNIIIMLLAIILLVLSIYKLKNMSTKRKDEII